MSQAPTVIIRDAADDDLAAIAAIYNDAVVNTTAIWNDVVVDVADRRAWHGTRVGAGFPVLVAEVGGATVGYASYGPFRAFDGYRHTAELSVYVAADRRGGGLGGALLGALVERARAGGVHVLVAAIEAGNGASIALHQRHGFSVTGRMPEVGRKFGRWLDLVLMSRVLD